MMFPSDKEFIRMVDQKSSQNCSVTRRVIDIANQTHGKCHAAIKGKTTQRQVPQIREETSMVPDHVMQNCKDVTLCCNVFFVNGLTFFASMSLHLKCRWVKAMNNAGKGPLLRVAKEVINVCNRQGFEVKMILANNQFSCLQDDPNSLNI